MPSTTSNYLQEGDSAPVFSYRDQKGAEHSTTGLKGKPFLVYFYPKDNTPGCTREACGFRDAWDELSDLGITIIGVSPDSEKSHDNFRQKQNLPFGLVSDPEKEIIKAYRAWGEKKMYGKTYEGVLRISYLIGPDGTITKVYPKVKPQSHAIEVLEDVKELF